MSKKSVVVMFLISIFVLIPIRVNAFEIDEKLVDSKYAINSVEVVCEERDFPAIGNTKCGFAVSGGKDITSIRVALYSNEKMSDNNGKYTTKYDLIKINANSKKVSKDGTLKIKSNSNNSNGTISDSDTVIETENKTKVKDIKCDTSISELIKDYWKWVMFLVPLLLIVLITLDFVKAMSSGDSDSIKKSSNNAIKRVIAAVILLALPWVLSVIFGWFGLEICF